MKSACFRLRRHRYYRLDNELPFVAERTDDESDLSNLTVTEKQIGVKFEGVRKVYHTERGDVVAVEDFTLNLCEGEVTSLLGRNGAGKTTIMYVNCFSISVDCYS